MHKTSYYIINAITLYRLVTAPLLLFLILYDQYFLFKWLLVLSFLTDAIDGILARRYKVVSAMGATLDSIGDDLTVVAGIVGLFVFKADFIYPQLGWLVFLLILFLVETIAALNRYGKTTSFHTILAKIAAILQGTFLILAFLLPEPVGWLFYLAIAFTALDLLEEIILVCLLPKWKTDVKGIYWVLKQDRESARKSPAGN